MKMVFYEDKPKWDWWAKFSIAFMPILAFALGFVALLDYYCYIERGVPKEETLMGTIVLFATTASISLLLWAIFPRKYQILEDRVKIVLGGPFSFNIGFETIKEVRGLKEKDVGSAWGLSFSPSIKTRVEILRKKGMNVTISPSNPDLFIKELSRVMANWRKSRGIS